MMARSTRPTTPTTPGDIVNSFFSTHPAGMRRLLGACTLCCAALAGASANAAAADGFDLAITVDDLSAHGALPRGQAWTGIAKSWLDTLAAHHVPEAYGFVNAKRIVDAPGSEAVLDAWRKAGHPLGNHTYSHLGLSQAPSLAAWQDDVKRGEPAIAGRMARADWHLLRFPFLDGGDTPARHDAAQAWLTKEGYRIADVSISFDDWAYTDAYARCLDKGDGAAAHALTDDYFRRVDQTIARTRAVSQRVYGRTIPQVLLTHMGAFSAATLPETLRRLEAAGARYVPLDRAQSDPAYRDPSPQAGNGTLMERHARDAKIDLAGLPAVSPTGNLDAVCR
jgi:peptidoglycan/xylan/chitin deacetylase (PgdA/CDA1 family)